MNNLPGKAAVPLVTALETEMPAAMALFATTESAPRLVPDRNTSRLSVFTCLSTARISAA